MDTNANELELHERLKLIECMMAEGRQKCESWGWTFLLWGVAYYVAFFWGLWTNFRYAWPITMVAAGLLTTAGFMVKDCGPNTTMSRAIGSIWMAAGVTMFILFFGLSFSGHMTSPRIFFAGAPAILGLANVACGLTLKWKAELACGLVWWAATLVACFGSPDAAMDSFLVAIFLCQIVFGIYAMILESRRRKQQNGAVNA
ncbi:MAG: hypothetical protein P4K93_14800 [Terracidiphilus sp.]|nr:hypothetical protein [Terracidiphilus sp.]MDR3799425.1 hypothetical protein [Terracidiphilus sp.]